MLYSQSTGIVTRPGWASCQHSMVRRAFPGLVTIPVDWEYSIPYGLLYAKDAPDDVLRFTKEVEKII